jgi:Protein of unknown function (DUF2934)
MRVQRGNNPKKLPSSISGPYGPYDPPLEEEIRARAHQLYEERGREEGHAMDDWLRAEEEVNRNRKRRAA